MAGKSDWVKHVYRTPIILSITYALFSATSATVNFSDACVLHKAWKIAKSNGEQFVTAAQLLAHRSEMVADYEAPKLANENEVLDAIENLKGLRALVLDGIKLHLKEKIVCFSNGEILN